MDDYEGSLFINLGWKGASLEADAFNQGKKLDNKEKGYCLITL